MAGITVLLPSRPPSWHTCCNFQYNTENYHFPPLNLTVVTGQWTCKWLAGCSSSSVTLTYSVSQCRSIAVKTVPFKTLENFLGLQQINLIFYETFRFLLIFLRLLTPRQNMEKLDTRQANSLLHLLKVPSVPFILIWWCQNMGCQNQPVKWYRGFGKVSSGHTAKSNQLQCLFWGYLGPATTINQINRFLSWQACRDNCLVVLEEDSR